MPERHVWGFFADFAAPPRVRPVSGPGPTLFGADFLDIRDQRGAHVLHKTAALHHLMVNHGLSESDARLVIDDVRADTQTYYVKYASSFDGFPQFPTDDIDATFGNEMNALMEVMDPMSRAKIYIDDSSGASVPMIRSKCRRLSARAGLDMIVIDYLQLMQASGNRKDGNRMQEISDMTRQLKLLARELNVPIILLCQLNRGPDTRTDHRPVISDLRESGSIEQDADMVILLYRPAAYMDTQEYEMGDNTSQIIIAKHRHGSTGVVKLLWQGEYTRFRSIAQENQ